MLFEAIVSSLKLTLSSLGGNLGFLPPWGVKNEEWSLPPPSSQPSLWAPSRRLGSGSGATFAQRTLKLFLKKKEWGREKKIIYIYIYSGLVVVDDAYHPPKPCGLQAQRFALAADQYPGPALG